MTSISKFTHVSLHLLRVGWRNMRITLIFWRIISFMLFTVLLSHMYFFQRISDSQFTSWIHDFEE